MLFKIKNRFKQIIYYNNDDFTRVIKKISDLKKSQEYNEYIHSIFLSIDSIAKYDHVNDNKNLILLKLGQKNIKNFTKTHTVKYYKLLYNNQLIWIDSFYVEKI